MFDQADLELSSSTLLESNWERREGDRKVLYRPSFLFRDPPFTQGEQFAVAGTLPLILSSLTYPVTSCLSVSSSSSVSPNTTTS